MLAVILAGGKGTRLKELTEEIPKPMLPIASKPILEHQIISLRNSGINKIKIIIGYLGSVIKQYFDDGSKWNVDISYIEEKTPLGTAGALYYLKNEVRDDFFIVYGDLMLDIDWMRLFRFHQKAKARITLFAHPNSHPYDSDLVLCDGSGKVTGIDPKNSRRNYYDNLVNAGIYVVSAGVLDSILSPAKQDFEKGLLTDEIKAEKVYAYRSSEYVRDMGTHERFASVTDDYCNRIVFKKNLLKKQKCIFLDRDGTVNILNGFINSADKFELIEGVAEAIKSINSSEYLCIVITNQPVLARGECTSRELEDIHKKMKTLLGESGAYVDDIFYCPHHPDSGYEGEVAELKVDCDCRKPKIGMILSAAEKYNIDLRVSWFVGDTTTDIMTGKNAGMKTALVLTGEAGNDGKYDCQPNIKRNSLIDILKYIITDKESE